MPRKITVYENGAPRQMWGVDAHEAVQRDPNRWSLSPPETTAAAPVAAVPRPAPLARPVTKGKPRGRPFQRKTPAPVAAPPAPEPEPDVDPVTGETAE